MGTAVMVVPLQPNARVILLAVLETRAMFLLALLTTQDQPYIIFSLVAFWWFWSLFFLSLVLVCAMEGNEWALWLNQLALTKVAEDKQRCVLIPQLKYHLSSRQMKSSP